MSDEIQSCLGQAAYTGPYWYPVRMTAWRENPITGAREYVYIWLEGGGDEKDVYFEDEPPIHLKKSIDFVREKNRKIMEKLDDLRKDIEENPLFFVCGYCHKNMTSITSLEGHIFSKRSYTDKKRFEITCGVRKAEEKIPKYVRKAYGKPGKYPWFHFISKENGKVLEEHDWDESTREAIDAHLQKAKKDYYKPGDE